MPQPLDNQKPAFPEGRSDTPVTQVETGKGLWMKGEDRVNKMERLSQSKPDLARGVSRK